jgi:pyruvate dehydrogenase E2 component (dihydrolipoamide acetyltransferase)
MVEVVTMPTLGLSERGELVSWEVDVGEEIEDGALLAVIESDKSSAEIEAPIGGTLLRTYVEEGEEIDIDPGRPIAVIGDAGEEAPSFDELDMGEEPSENGTETEPKSAVKPAAANGSPTTSSEIKATPRAKKYAEEHAVDLIGVEGTGPQGAITEDDVKEFVESGGAETAEPSSETSDGLTITEARELSGVRKTVAERLSESARQKPHVMGTREIGIGRLSSARDRLNSHYDVDLSLNDLIIHFVGRTLEDRPEFNAHFDEEVEEHRLIEEVNVGYAVDSPKGLIVPVIEDVPGRSIAELATERREMVEAVLDDEHAPTDLQGGTFTITNVGVFDMDVSYSIINPPEVAILAVGRRKQAAVERNGSVEFEPVITFSLTIDHRVLDGADSGAFLDQLAEYIEYPGRVFDAIE